VKHAVWTTVDIAPVIAMFVPNVQMDTISALQTSVTVRYFCRFTLYFVRSMIICQTRLTLYKRCYVCFYCLVFFRKMLSFMAFVVSLTTKRIYGNFR